MSSPSCDDPATPSLPQSAEQIKSESVRAPGALMKDFVALSKFVIANGMTAEVKAAFRDRPHRVDHVSGFLRMDVISPLELPNEIWLITFWTDESKFRAWHHSHLYQDSHKGIPKGLKLAPGETKMRFFELVAS